MKPDLTNEEIERIAVKWIMNPEVKEGNTSSFMDGFKSAQSYYKERAAKDAELTERLKEALETVNNEVPDHIEWMEQVRSALTAYKEAKTRT